MTTHAVLSHPSGRTINVQNIRSNEYYEMVNMLGYEVLFSGTKRECTEHQERLAARMLEAGIYE